MRRAVDWVEAGALHPDSITAQVLRGEREDPDQAEKDEANRRRAARRAKTRCRRLCKAQGLDTLLTLTYRGLQDDLALAKRHFQLLRKRLGKALGDFAYVAAFERQKRGAWHVHVATRRLPRAIQRQGVKVKSWNVIRAMWRDVAGEYGGNVDVSARRSVFRSPAKCAGYLSKYMLKDWDQHDAGGKRMLASQASIPEPTRHQMKAVSDAELRHLVASVFEWATLGRDVAGLHWSRFGDSFYVAGELSRTG